MYLISSESKEKSFIVIIFVILLKINGKEKKMPQEQDIKRRYKDKINVRFYFLKHEVYYFT